MFNLFKRKPKITYKHSCNKCGNDLSMGMNGGLCFNKGCILYGVYQCFKENMDELQIKYNEFHNIK